MPAMAGITKVAWSPTTAENDDPSGTGTAAAPGVQPYIRNESGSEGDNPSGAKRRMQRGYILTA